MNLTLTSHVGVGVKFLYAFFALFATFISTLSLVTYGFSHFKAYAKNHLCEKTRKGGFVFFICSKHILPYTPQCSAHRIQVRSYGAYQGIRAF